MKRLVAGLLFVASPSLAQVAQNTSPVTTPTIQASQYVSGNSLGGLQKISWYRTPGAASGIVDQVAVFMKTTATPAITFYIYKGNPTHTTCTDQVAFAQGDEPLLATAPFTVTPSASTGTTHTSVTQTIVFSIRNVDSPVTNNIYVCAVDGTTFTPASASDFTFSVSGVID